MDISVQVSIYVPAYNLLGNIPRSPVAGSCVNLCLSFRELRIRLYAFDSFPDISEIGRSAKSYCEHTARTQPTLSDIVVTLVEMGECTISGSSVQLSWSYGRERSEPHLLSVF